jgi:hypothetical protein
MTRDQLQKLCEELGVKLLPWQETMFLHYMNLKPGGQIVISKPRTHMRGMEPSITILDETERL